MALSQQTLDHLLEAESHMRAAIKSAAINEKAIIVSQLSKILLDMQRTKSIEEVMEMIENREPGSSGRFGIQFTDGDED